MANFFFFLMPHCTSMSSREGKNTPVVGKSGFSVSVGRETSAESERV